MQSLDHVLFDTATDIEILYISLRTCSISIHFHFATNEIENTDNKREEMIELNVLDVLCVSTIGES